MTNFYSYGWLEHMRSFSFATGVPAELRRFVGIRALFSQFLD